MNAAPALPEELICSILSSVYYNAPFGTPDYPTLLACSLVNSNWRVPSQTLLFRRVTTPAAPSFARHVASANEPALLSHVRSFSTALGVENTPQAGRDFCTVSELISILKHCPQIYELSISAHRLFSIGLAGLSGITAVVGTASIEIRSLKLVDCSVQSPILYELLALFPTVEFLTLGVEVAASPPAWTPTFRLYELTLHRTCASEVLAWLLLASSESLRILELRDLPSERTPSDLAMCCPHIQSLRLMRFNAHSAIILRQCTGLLELVLLNVPTLVTLPELPHSLEHFALLIQTYTTSVDLRPVIAAVDSLPRLRILSFIGDLQDISLLKASCDAKGVILQANWRKFWINDDPVKATRFPRRRSVSNFYLMR
ncbi:hypothetical protein C8R47DRAFT_1020508 [Mycena vitilis]|nr:hypothetical protein C8R47DRAFT_1020508 [Mycena vitilis]